MVNIPSEEIKKIIIDPEGAEILVRNADRIGEELKKQGLSTNQIRALFGEVRQIQAQWSIPAQHTQARRRMVLLKPKMAYRARKERGKAVQDLVSVLDPALEFVIQEKDPDIQGERFQRFVEFFEAILAYHRGYGGS